MSDQPVRLEGEARRAGATDPASPASVAIEADGFSVTIGGSPPIGAAYRDITTLAVDQGRALLALGEGPGAQRLFLERFGQGLGTLVSELRERRARQRLTDRLVTVGVDPLPLVEYRIGSEHGVAQLAYHDWGAVLIPLDERRRWRDVRRGEIAAVRLVQEMGGVEIAVRASADEPADAPLELLGLGAGARLDHDRFVALRDGGVRDAAALVAGLVPDAPFAARQRAAGALIDGRPTTPAELGDAWDPIEAAVLGEPTFAATYAALRTHGGPAAPVWLAVAPATPGSPEARAWFFVALPGNLVAMELVTEGAHATYCYRIVPRDAYRGEEPAALAGPVAEAVAEVSHALVDSRYLREPMALPEDQLRVARHLRYRMALAALPSLAAARRRFVARLVHRDEASWATALDDLIAWHGAARDDAAVWPGRAAQESDVSEAAEPSPMPSG